MCYNSGPVMRCARVAPPSNPQNNENVRLILAFTQKLIYVYISSDQREKQGTQGIKTTKPTIFMQWKLKV